MKLDCPPDEPLLLASVQSELWLLGVHSGGLNLLSSVSRPVFSLDYHWAQQRVYWLSPEYQSIRWADIKNPNSRGTLIKGTCSKTCVLSEMVPNNGAKTVPGVFKLISMLM